MASFPAATDEARQALDGLSLDAPAEVAEKLSQFGALLSKWQAAQNLVSRETLAHFWSRHAIDSLQVHTLLQASDGLVVDLGSGGGFPAIPLAIASADSDRRFVMVESNQRKVAFLRTAIRELGLKGKVVASRIETVDSRETGAADIVTARALAPLNLLCAMAFPILRSDGRMLVHKGRENGEEVAAAGAQWAFDVLKHPSITDGQGVILEISNLRPKSPA